MKKLILISLNVRPKFKSKSNIKIISWGYFNIIITIRNYYKLKFLKLLKRKCKLRVPHFHTEILTKGTACSKYNSDVILHRLKLIKLLLNRPK